MPRQERAERTRLAILDAAAVEFDAHGYEGARLDRIIERTGATKGAVYFHFPSKLAIARALVEEKYGNWPVIVAEVTGSGLTGLAAAEEITQRVGTVFASDVHVRAAMKLSQTVLPPPVDDNPYDRWVGLIAMFVRQALGERPSSDDDAREIATVAVHTFFGAYMIAQELGRLATLPDDISRMWKVLAVAVAERAATTTDME
ncbi:TetR/AcrR family transcriptional regulator [Leifsonia sp. F6_8S_P_1B]|uniref:TetR/AcrR family transcriptional regulator n=1 Tax=Leifsonia williamsii TaxID=3035919 RepID=A0ABT8KAI4_9MICO|nr:TetR/AcrR family transcriptional regulator [Leifsonia williamsii]MDN4614187.1 TetR/AcrR family transcriptional regulator [Leifsonia williamsii]